MPSNVVVRLAIADYPEHSPARYNVPAIVELLAFLVIYLHGVHIKSVSVADHILSPAVPHISGDSPGGVPHIKTVSSTSHIRSVSVVDHINNPTAIRDKVSKATLAKLITLKAGLAHPTALNVTPHQLRLGKY